MLALIGLKGVTVSYQTINQSNEHKVKVFPEHTDEQLEELIARAQSTYQNDWSQKDASRTQDSPQNATSIMLGQSRDFWLPFPVSESRILKSHLTHPSACS
jgi:succinate-semialdehyde dehydrogenase / glutarate-semialdehyde dehydrogenase